MSRPVVSRPPRPVGSSRSLRSSAPPPAASPLVRWAAPILLAAPVGLAVLIGGSLPDVARGQDAGQQGAAAKAHPLEKALQYAKVSLKAAESLPSYTATLKRREIVDGKPVENEARMKFRAEPFSVYLQFTNPENAGRQVLYVEGANDGKMLVREAAGISSLAGTVSLAPDSALVSANSRHPITRAGLANLTRKIVQQWTTESRYGECDVKYYADAQLDGRPVVVIESSHPIPRHEFRFARTRLWMDKETKLPVRLQQYEFRRGGGEPVLAEDYTYTDIKGDVRLTDRDFHPASYKL
ncbi:DUF1571 domain-containing protein [Alienimonas californiensis]|uniref:Outer membrane lipoprotein-sorting protein n=1 Tax=Alienimonas californiensis TaxID=2527989 RepID=A0A517PEU3_9PLAN|nr:DUF1571 domain-containing protein [Alienimonas californiensis]QDT17886.1 hypothetical protein CA12_40220 [Alienimonas californiensis]